MAGSRYLNDIIKYVFFSLISLLFFLLASLCVKLSLSGRKLAQRAKCFCIFHLLISGESQFPCAPVKSLK